MDSTLFTRCFRCMEDMGSDSLCPHCGYDNSHGNPQPYALPAGTILRGKYVLGLPLGQGGFGITYIGWEVAAGRKVAIKEYFPTGQVSRSQEKGRTELIWYSTEQANFAQHDGMDAFLREARKMEKVSKIPQVVSILEVFEENATAYIVMDYIQGENLKDRIQRTGPMSWEEAEKIFLPVAKAMAQVHKAGLIHRDLSPDNLIIQPDGTVRILDLGAAKDLSINTGVSSMQVAKNGFSPPEQYTQQGGSGTWTDVYALAATMYFAVTGKLPPSAMDRLTEDALQWDNPQIAALPENAAIAMQKAMVLFRNNRTQTMEDFMADLGCTPAPRPQPKPAPQPESKAKPQPKPEPKPQAKKPKKGPAFYVCLAIVVLGLVISGICFAVTEDAEPQSSPNTVSSVQESKPAQPSEKNSSGLDQETMALVDAGTDDTYIYSDGSFAELYFNDKGQERCRAFFAKGEKLLYYCVADYDSNGNMTEQRVYDGDQKLMRKDTCAYNKNGDVTEEHWVDANNRVQRYTLRKYDSRGRYVSGICKNTSNEVIWEASSTYDHLGQESRSVKRADGTTDVMNFDRDGNLAEQERLDSRGKRDRYWRSTYDSSGHEILCVSYNSSNALDCQWEYTYEGDLLTKEVYASYGDDPYTMVRTYAYVRDACLAYTSTVDSGSPYLYEMMTCIDGSRLRICSVNQSNGYRTETLYDHFGNAAFSTNYDGEGEIWQEEEYSYDERDCLIGKTVTSYNYDGSGYTVTEYDGDYNKLSEKKYDANGKLISGA